ncbi:hypothetical protein [Bradyrhizobium japonicum]|nr:hypothetical protein [Bradyrhizobium japonicum]
MVEKVEAIAIIEVSPSDATAPANAFREPASGNQSSLTPVL